MDTRSVPGLLPRHLLVSVALGAMVLVGTLTVAPAAVSQEGGSDGSPTTARIEGDPQLPRGDILPRPGSGQAPTSPNDPGGWQQYMVFGLIFAGLGLIVLLIVRESRRARRGQGSHSPTG